MPLTVFCKRAKVTIATALLLIFVATPLLTSAQSIYGEIQALQQQIQIIRDVVLDAEGSNAPSYEEKQQMLTDLSTLENTLAGLQLAIGANSSVRTNIVALEVTGDIRTFTSDVTIVYDEEIINGKDMPVATSTYSYSFTAVNPASDVKARARELRDYTYEAVAKDTGLPFSMVKSAATISFDKFTDKHDVAAYMGGYTPAIISITDKADKRADDLLDMFARYSVINDITFGVGALDDNRGVEVLMHSDQGELLRLNFGTPCRTAKDGLACTPGTFVYQVTYSVYDVPVLIVRSPQSTPIEVFQFLARTLEDTEVWKVYGTESAATSSLKAAPNFYGNFTVLANMWGGFSLPSSVTGEDAIAFHLTTFLTQQNTYLRMRGTPNQTPVAGYPNPRYEHIEVNTCVSDRVKASGIALMEYFIVGRLQHEAPLYELADWYIPARYERDANISCMTVTDGDGRPVNRVTDQSFFPGLPAFNWQAAIKDADPDVDEAWFLD